LGYPHPPMKQHTSRTYGGSSLREDVPPVGLVDQSRPEPQADKTDAL
jgi:hypothetical protein